MTEENSDNSENRGAEDRPRDGKTLLWRGGSLFIVLVSALVYVGCWTGGPVWDDHFFLNGSGIGGGESFRNCFTHPFLDHYFRPLVSVSFFFERKVWGWDTTGYHITNTLLHVIASGMMVELLREAFGGRRIALIGGLLFALHPVQVGAVAWIGGRTDALCEVWMVLFLWMLIRAAKRNGDARAWPLFGAVVGFTLAIYTKEQVLAAVPLIPIAFRIWKPKKGFQLPGTIWWLSLPFALSTILFLVLGYYLGFPRPHPLPLGFATVFAQIGQILAYYALLLFVPTRQWMYTYSLNSLENAGAWAVVFGYGCLLLALISIWRWWKTQPAVAWFIGLLLLSLLPVSGLAPLPYLLVAPYRAGVAGIAAAAIVAWALDALYRYVEGRGKREEGKGTPQHQGASSPAANSSLFPLPSSLVTLSLVLWYGALTVWGASRWDGDMQFFTTILQYDPGSLIARQMYADRLETVHRDREAAQQLEILLQGLFGSDAWRDPKSAQAVFRTDQRVRLSARQNQGSQRPPEEWVAGLFAGLGNNRQRAGDNWGALVALYTGAAIRPGDANVEMGLGYLAGKKGNEEEGARHMRAALLDAPLLAYPHEWLGWYYRRKSDWVSAKAEFAAWMKADPTSKEARTALADMEKQLARH